MQETRRDPSHYFPNLAALLRLNLLTYRDLWGWLDAPFERPLSMPAPTQVRLFAS